MLKYMPDHFGRHGFKRPQKMVCAKITMNVSDLEERLEGLVKDGYAVKEGKATQGRPNQDGRGQAPRVRPDLHRRRM